MHRRRTGAVLATALALLHAGGGAPAQGPSPWAALGLPGGTAGASIQSLGKQVVVQEATALHVFSAFTRAWHSLPTGAGASVRLANDWLLVQDGATWTAFAAMTGRFAPLGVSPAAQVVNPTAQRNDSLLLVRDGTALHAFSGFGGSWLTRPVSPQALVLVQRHVALVEDGPTAGGLSAFAGGWIDLALPALPGFASADGTTAVVEANGTLHGFSALHGAWASQPALPGTPSRHRNSDFALWHDGQTVIAYSGLRGAFATATLNGPVTVQSDELLAVLRDGQIARCYSAVTNTFALLALPASGHVTLGQGVVLLSDGGSHAAFSAPLGTVATLLLGSSAEDATGVVAYVVDGQTSVPHLFSALTGRWHQAPPDALPGQPLLAAQLALLPTATGFHAFSARSGAFVPLASGNGVPDLNRSSSLCLVWDPAAHHVFDPRHDRWLHAPRASNGAPTARLWRTAMVVADGPAAFGFGAQEARIAAVTPVGPITGSNANSECGYVTTAGQVLAFGAVPEVVSQAQFPEFRRVFAAGATVRLWLRLPQGHAAFLALGPRGTPAALPGLGELILDPAGSASLLVLPDAGAERATLGIPVPDLPVLRGSEWFFQPLVLPPAGAAWLGGATSLLVL